MALLDRPYGPSSGNPSGLSVIAQDVQGEGPGPLPALQVISSTAETLIVNPANTALVLTVQIPPNTELEQTLFDLIASGYIKTTNTTNITLKLYSGAAIVSGNLLKSSGAIAQNTLTLAFYVKGNLIYDSVSGILAGTVKFYLAETLVAEATLANFVTGINNAANPGPVAEFCLSITSSAATALLPTTINVQKFSAG